LSTCVHTFRKPHRASCSEYFEESEVKEWFRMPNPKILPEPLGPDACNDQLARHSPKAPFGVRTFDYIRAVCEKTGQASSSLSRFRDLLPSRHGRPALRASRFMASELTFQSSPSVQSRNASRLERVGRYVMVGRWPSTQRSTSRHSRRQLEQSGRAATRSGCAERVYESAAD